MVEEFMNHNIDVYFVKLTEKDPSDLGFRKMVDVIKQTPLMKFSDLMRYRLSLRENSRNRFGNTMMIGKFMLQ